MTDSEVTGEPPWAGSAPPLAPTAVAPHRRRRWVLFTLAAVVVVASLAAGLVAWAPWIPPPVLRPAGLAPGPATANSISFRWSRPPTGPLPDKYLILTDGTVAGSVAGTGTSYRHAGLTHATRYQYRVVADRGGKRSPQSALLTVRTLTPPISQARLQGTWNVKVKYIQRVFGYPSDTLSWATDPVCAAGPCDVLLQVTWSDGHAVDVKLTRAGVVYRGQTLARFFQCGTSSPMFPDPTTLIIQVRVTAAAGQGQVWAATSLAGTMVGTSQYVSVPYSGGIYYCSASTFHATLSGTPD